MDMKRQRKDKKLSRNEKGMTHILKWCMDSYLGIILFLVMGFGALLYPSARNLWNDVQNSRLSQKYTDKVAMFREEEREQLYQEALLYNQNHKQNMMNDWLDRESQHQEYQQLLNVKDGMMGMLVIPKIKEKLVIYHGISADVLEKGCGHVEGTSLPVGGENSHGVYAGHRGLPTAKLFTDLDQLVIGDKFYFYILGQYLAYEVDQITVVLPTEVENIQIEEGKDLATLVTCTPYGVNSHRLLIRGHRVLYEKQEVQVENNQALHQKLLLASVVVLGLGLLVIRLCKK